MEYHLAENIIDVIEESLLIKISNDIYIESDLDTYIQITGSKNICSKIKNKMIDNLIKLIASYDFISKIRYIMDPNGTIMFMIEKKYSEEFLVILPEDTLINNLYKNGDTENKDITEKQKRLLETSNTYENDYINLFQYNALIDYISKHVESAPFLQIKYNNYVLSGIMGDVETKQEIEYLIKMYTPEYLDDDIFDEHINEAFVGLFGTNKLRKIIPNFSLVRSILFDKECPIIRSNPRHVEIFNPKHCTYIMYEYIKGDTSFEFIKSVNLDMLKSIIKQIIFALYEANKLINFTHFDLHLGNIIIKELSNEITIYYPSSDEKIITKYVSVIIDYGSSHIKYNNFDYGKILYEGNVVNDSFWIHDIFKMLMFFYTGILEYNNQKSLKKYVSTLLSFFTGEEMTDILYEDFKESNEYFAVRYSTKFKDTKFSFDNFISFVINNI